MARADGPITAAELHETMDEGNRPGEGEDEDRRYITGVTADLYGKNYVDRRKRDVKYRPFEYWVAAKGLEELGDDLPDDPNVYPPDGVGVQEEEEEEDRPLTPSETVEEQLGFDDPDRDSKKALAELFASLSGRVFGVERSVETRPPVGREWDDGPRRPSG